jgi:hypothetical protein
MLKLNIRIYIDIPTLKAIVSGERLRAIMALLFYFYFLSVMGTGKVPLLLFRCT